VERANILGLEGARDHRHEQALHNVEVQELKAPPREIAADPLGQGTVAQHANDVLEWAGS
jgi:hypothetical protein